MSGSGPFWIDPFNETAGFPDVSLALKEPDGLLAIGGSLSPKRLINAYPRGIFPWYCAGQPILWWSPDPRAVLYPENLKVSRSMIKVIKKELFKVTLDSCFREVIQACSEPRKEGNGTWLTPEMIEAYCQLNELGFAHSVECWLDKKLVGGLYGIAIGKVFFGESMFSRVSNASKLAFIHLVYQLQTWGYKLIDCQVQSNHLRSLGSQDIPRTDFVKLLNQLCKLPGQTAPWQLEIKLAKNLF